MAAAKFSNTNFEATQAWRELSTVLLGAAEHPYIQSERERAVAAGRFAHQQVPSGDLPAALLAALMAVKSELIESPRYVNEKVLPVMARYGVSSSDVSTLLFTHTRQPNRYYELSDPAVVGRLSWDVHLVSPAAERAILAVCATAQNADREVVRTILGWTQRQAAHLSVRAMGVSVQAKLGLSL